MTDSTETDLLAAVERALFSVDPPPEHVIAHAKAAQTWQSIDAELAELVYDSTTSDAVAVRGSTREVTFRAPGVEVEVMVLSERHRSLVGQVVPAQQAVVELRHRDAATSTTTDRLGRFSFERLPPGPIKLVVVTDTGMRVQTEGLVI